MSPEPDGSFRTACSPSTSRTPICIATSRSIPGHIAAWSASSRTIQSGAPFRLPLKLAVIVGGTHREVDVEFTRDSQDVTIAVEGKVEDVALSTTRAVLADVESYRSP